MSDDTRQPKKPKYVSHKPIRHAPKWICGGYNQETERRAAIYRSDPFACMLAKNIVERMYTLKIADMSLDPICSDWGIKLKKRLDITPSGEIAA